MARIVENLIKPRTKQMSDSMYLGMLLMAAAGFMDAYSYGIRDNVFANAQTGNVVLFAGALAKGEYSQSLHYLIPIITFIIGVFITSIMRKRLYKIKIIHWRQLVLLAEIILLGLVSFMSEEYNTLANIFLSFACSMQMNTFSKFWGIPLTTTVCTGNLKNATDSLCNYLLDSEKKAKIKSFYNYLFVVIFTLGAALGAIFTNLIGVRSILLPMILMIIGFVMMFKEEK